MTTLCYDEYSFIKIIKQTDMYWPQLSRFKKPVFFL